MINALGPADKQVCRYAHGAVDAAKPNHCVAERRDKPASSADTSRHGGYWEEDLSCRLVSFTILHLESQITHRGNPLRVRQFRNALADGQILVHVAVPSSITRMVL